MIVSKVFSTNVKTSFSLRGVKIFDKNIPTFTLRNFDVQNKQGECYLIKYTEEEIEDKYNETVRTCSTNKIM